MIKSKDNIKIAWKIFAYEDCEQIIYTINYILENSQEDVVFLHYDLASSEEDFNQITQHFINNDRVFCYQKFRTAWGSIQMCKSELFILSEIHRYEIAYDYSINMTGKMFFTKNYLVCESI